MINVYEMELHDSKAIDDFTDVLRVPGGWIYKTLTYSDKHDTWYPSSVFVPYDNEFQGKG